MALLLLSGIDDHKGSDICNFLVFRRRLPLVYHLHTIISVNESYVLSTFIDLPLQCFHRCCYESSVPFCAPWLLAVSSVDMAGTKITLITNHCTIFSLHKSIIDNRIVHVLYRTHRAEQTCSAVTWTHHRKY